MKILNGTFNVNRIYALLMVLSVANFALFINAATSPSAQTLLTSNLCNIINDVKSVIGFFALAMFLIGGLLYAGGHFMPAAGNLKGSMQGWAMGMVMGGIIGLVLVILAPTIVGIIVGFSSTGVTTPTC